ncbi:MAG: hypothetical protein AUK44_04660 [Porphyromonadaceae bacterium CG2_30_38_12]|nr:MAG: hypothetical protein AUK44_04660 [Porphyromonadaceae bacterium CG2_30_38_12]
MTSSEINYTYLFDVYPDPLVVVNKKGQVIATNATCKDIFKAISNEYSLEDSFVEAKKFQTMVNEMLKYNHTITEIVALKVKQNVVKTFIAKATVLSHIKELYVFIFLNLQTSNNILKSELSSIYLSELNALNPYLNKAGKELLQAKMKENKILQVLENEANKFTLKNFLNKDEQLRFQSQFPNLSNKELLLCYFMFQQAHVQQIATILSKTPNAVSVMQFRILRKLQVKTVNELIHRHPNLLHG